MTTLPARFTPLRRLGEGSFGTAHEVLDGVTGERVALKTLRRFDADGLLRFKREFRALADVRHRNLVRFGELFSEGNEWLFTMELVRGVTLLEYVTASPGAGATGAAAFRSRFDEARLRDAFAQLVEGVNAIHGAGMLHRDLKPSNVLVTPEGRVVILDFGLVAHVSEGGATRSTQAVGTPAYMSPEHADGEGVSASSDWYCLGLMLFEALTGNLPFEGSAIELIVKRQTEEAPRPSQRAGSVPKDLDDICFRLLARSPSERPGFDELSRAFPPASAAPATRLPPKLRAPTSADEVFVGREAELASLRAAFAKVVEGRPASVLVGGTSGIGKSTLVRRFLTGLAREEQDLLALRARCYQRESVPYKALDGIVDQLTAYLNRLEDVEAARVLPRDWPALARLFPVLAPLGERVASRRRATEIPDPLEARRRGFRAIREMLGRLAEQKLVVLAIDDLHWGDADSALLLREITAPPDPPPLMILGTYRSDERSSSPFFEELDAMGAEGLFMETLRLGGLPLAEAVELALAHTGEQAQISREAATALAEEAGGVPLFLGELLRHGREAPAGSGGPMDTLRLERAIGARFETLSDGARTLLKCFAVAGRPLPISVANQAAGLDPRDTQTVDELEVGRWVRTRGPAGSAIGEPYHDRIREAVLGAISVTDASSYHDRLAQALNRTGEADAETLAEHFAHSGDHELAARHALRAADQAAEALAFDRAARLYERGFGLWQPASDEARRSVRVRWARALANAGRGDEAARTYLEAAKTAEPGERLELRRVAAEHLLNAGSIDEGLDVLGSVLSDVGMRLPRSPRVALASLLLRRAQLRIRGLSFRPRRESEVDAASLRKVDISWTAGIGLAMVDVVRSADFQARHLVMALRAGEPGRVARAFISEAGTSSAAGTRGARRTAALLERCRQLAGEIDTPYVRGWLSTVEGIAANLGGDFPQALEHARVGEKILREECTGVTWERDTALLYELHSLVNIGGWRELTDRAGEVLAAAQARRDLYMGSYVMTRNLFLGHLLDDRVAAAQAAQEAGLGSWSRQGFHVQHYWDWYARGEIDLYSGNPGAGWARVAAQWSSFRQSLLFLTQALSIEMRFLRARLAVACAVDDPGGAERFLVEAEAEAKWLRKERSPWAAAAGLLVTGCVRSVRGAGDEARDFAGRAAEAFGRLGIEHYAAAAALRAGRAEPVGTGPADAWFDRERPVDPERILEMLAPGTWN